jgi:hypothetical protein
LVWIVGWKPQEMVSGNILPGLSPSKSPDVEPNEGFEPRLQIFFGARSEFESSEVKSLLLGLAVFLSFFLELVLVLIKNFLDSDDFVEFCEKLVTF